MLERVVFLRMRLFTPLDNHRVVCGGGSKVSFVFGGIFRFAWRDVYFVLSVLLIPAARL